jgi:hypothetical protein
VKGIQRESLYLYVRSLNFRSHFGGLRTIFDTQHRITYFVSAPSNILPTKNRFRSSRESSHQFQHFQISRSGEFMKRTFATMFAFAALLMTAVAIPASAQQNDCVSVDVRPFYPGQAGTEMFWLTNNCGQAQNIDFATKGVGTQLVQLASGQGGFTGFMGQTNKPYKLWYCPQPSFPSDPNNEPLNGPTYEAQTVVCRK